MVYYDHQYEGNGGRCTYPVLRYNDNFDHDFRSESEYCTRCETYTVFLPDSELEGAGRTVCKCSNTEYWNNFNKNAPPYGPYFSETYWVCGIPDCRKSSNDTVHLYRDYGNCGAEKHSVLHDPEDLHGHWCANLEAGGDCMHFEDY